jgi:hypothetical protein
MTVGRVYAIVNNDESIRYVGSTTKTLNQRFSTHKSNYKRWIDGKGRCCMIYHAIREHGIDSFHIEMLEEIEFNDKCELLQLENKYISELECVNKHSAFTGIKSDTEQEYKKLYYEANQEKIKEKQKQYREANRDKIREKMKQYLVANRDAINEKFDCECGGRYTHRHIAKHLRTKKHTDYLNSL